MGNATMAEITVLILVLWLLLVVLIAWAGTVEGRLRRMGREDGEDGEMEGERGEGVLP